MKAKIAEVFASVQGEGIYQGVRQIFIRFAGCIQHCNFCLSKDTNINLSNGRNKKIKDLKKEDALIAFDEINQVPANTLIDRIFQGEAEEIFELELEDGNKLKITAEHAVFTRRGWTKIKDLQLSDEVLTIQR